MMWLPRFAATAFFCSVGAHGAEHTTLRFRISAAKRAACSQLQEGGDEDAPPQPPHFADVQEIPFTHLFYPFGMVNSALGRMVTTPPPWAVAVNPNCKAFRSHWVTEHLERYFTYKAPGMNISYRAVLNTLERQLCIPYIVGGMVRDALWMKEGLDTDIGFTCSIGEIAAIARMHGWPINTKEDYMNIGEKGAQDRIEGKPAQFSVYANCEDMEYAVNSVVYDVGINSAILDITGQAVEDDRSKTIRIPCGNSTRNAWAKGDGGTVKLVRYWKLRAKPKSFTGEPETHDFVIKTLKHRIEDNSTSAASAAVTKHELAHFVKGLDAADAAEKMGYIREVMVLDLGSDWYDAHIRPLEPSPSPSAVYAGDTGISI